MINADTLLNELFSLLHKKGRISMSLIMTLLTFWVLFSFSGLGLVEMHSCCIIGTVNVTFDLKIWISCNSVGFICSLTDMLGPLIPVEVSVKL